MKTLKLFLTAILMMQTISVSAQAGHYYLVGEVNYKTNSGYEPKFVVSMVQRIYEGCSISNLKNHFISDYNKNHPDSDFQSLDPIEVVGPFAYDHLASEKRIERVAEIYNSPDRRLIQLFSEYNCKNVAPANPTSVNPNVKPSSGSGSSGNRGYINIEKKDTKFQESEAKRKLDEKKAEVRQQVKLQALKNKAQPQEKQQIRKVLVGSSRQ